MAWPWHVSCPYVTTILPSMFPTSLSARVCGSLPLQSEDCIDLYLPLIAKNIAEVAAMPGSEIIRCRRDPDQWVSQLYLLNTLRDLEINLLALRERARLALVGPQGPQGEPGPAGPTGETGAPGAIGATGLTGPIGLAGPMPSPGGAGWMDFLTAALGALRAMWPSGDGGEPAVLPVPPAPPPSPPPSVGGTALEVVTPGGTLDFPVIPGSRDDPGGVYRPMFPDQRLQAVLMELYRLWLMYEAQHQQEEGQKQARETYEAMERAWLAYYAAVMAARQGGGAMPFGQMGFQAPTTPTVGAGDAGFWGGVVDVGAALGGTMLADWLEDLLGRGGEPRREIQPFYPPQLPAGYPPTGGYVPSIAEQAGAGLFRSTVSRVVPRSEISVIGPDGKTHTWLHARPKGWKINRCNVSGRRRRHHHHPR